MLFFFLIVTYFCHTLSVESCEETSLVRTISVLLPVDLHYIINTFLLDSWWRHRWTKKASSLFFFSWQSFDSTSSIRIPWISAQLFSFLLCFEWWSYSDRLAYFALLGYVQSLGHFTTFNIICMIKNLCHWLTSQSTVADRS